MMLGLGGLARACSSLLRQSVAAPLTISSPSLSNSSPMQKVRVDPAVLDIPVQYNVEREVWVESLATKETQLTSIMPLHPDVWAVYPRMDIIHQNLVWQQKYNVVNYNHVKNVREMIYAHGGGAKPWRQKGTGRARQGSRRAPQWVRGGKVRLPYTISTLSTTRIPYMLCFNHQYVCNCYDDRCTGPRDLSLSITCYHGMSVSMDSCTRCQ